jgi:23S rRNA pseudouridine2604 synthase
MPEEINYPIRINRYLELKGVATRKGADELIEQGQVFVNGHKAVLGYKVEQGDKVEVEQSRELVEKKYVYYAFNKPRGIITNVPQEGEKDIASLIKKQLSTLHTTVIGKVFALGRLDKESEGLILLTNDGRITDRLLNPKFAHEKEYEVEVKEKVSPMHKKILEGGVNYKNYEDGPRNIKLKAKKVEILGQRHLAITLTEGKKHEIRRMLDGAHLTVASLKRVRVMNIKLGNLASGKLRPLTRPELKEFLNSLNIIG